MFIYINIYVWKIPVLMLCVCINFQLFIRKLAITHINMLLIFHYTHIYIFCLLSDMVMNIYYLIEKSTAIFKQQKNILDNINKMNRALPYRIQHLLNFPYVALKSKVH